MDRTRITALTQFLANAEKLHIGLPKPVLAAITRNSKIRAGIEAIQPHNLTGVAVAVADALARDADINTDPAVARAITHSIITGTGVFNHIEIASLAHLADSCEMHQNEIVIALREKFDVAAAALVSAHERIGNVALTDSATILRQGSPSTALWASAVEAQTLIDSLIGAWFSLGQLIHPAPADRRYISLRVVDPAIDSNAAKYDAEEWGRVPVSAWGAICKDVVPSLPTRAQYLERINVLNEYRAEIAAAAQRPAPRPSYLTVK